MDLISNPWVIGIGTGFISGLLVYWITNLIVHKKVNKEYQQSLRAANNEILYTIRPLIVDKVLPPIPVVRSLLGATARKYNVNQKDLYTIGLLVDDLTKEVLENPFLTSEVRMSYCTVLLQLVNEELKDISDQEIEVKSNRTSESQINSMSFFLAFSVAIVTMLGFALSIEKGSLYQVDNILLPIPLIIGVLMSLAAIMLLGLKIMRLVHKHRRRVYVTESNTINVETTDGNVEKEGEDGDE